MKSSVTVPLNLAGHCIETAAKKEFKRLMDLCFCSPSEDPARENALELLREFIETADFPTLRASDGRLAGIGEVPCILQRNDRGEPVLVISE